MKTSIVILIGVIQLTLLSGLFYLLLNLATSLGKSGSKSCNETWPIDQYVASDLFCPKMR